MDTGVGYIVLNCRGLQCSFITKLSCFHDWWWGVNIFEAGFMRCLFNIYLRVRVIVLWKWLFLSNDEESVGWLFQYIWIEETGACICQINPIHSCIHMHPFVEILWLRCAQCFSECKATYRWMYFNIKELSTPKSILLPDCMDVKQ